MSRRYRHGRPPHRPHRGHGEPAARGTASSPAIHDAAEPAAASGPAQEQPAGRRPAAEPPSAERLAERPTAAPPAGGEAARDVGIVGTLTATAEVGGGWHGPANGGDPAREAGGTIRGAVAAPGAAEPSLQPASIDAAAAPGCTAAQLRRFIKSRPWVPMHELRRRFAINGTEDDVAPLELDGRRVFVGLPSREAGLMAELVRAGDVGIELSLDPGCPMVIGVFPMRPISRG